MSYIVGLTGGIGSGKSTIADYFAQLGVPIIDADIIARQVVGKGTSLLVKIQAHFGEGILTEQGELNRTALREIVFANPEQKAWLNALLHPAIRDEMLKQLEQVTFPYAIWVVPLLIENRLFEYCQRILVVDVSPNIQLERALSRDQSSEETIKNIMQAQVSREVRLSYADDVIENSLPLSDNAANLQLQVSDLHQYYLTLSEANKELL